MSLVVAAIAAAATAGVAGGALALRWWARRRSAARQPPSEGSAPSLPEGSMPSDGTLDELPLSVGDVVQVDLESRWLGSAVLLREASRLRAALLFAEEPGGQKTVAALAHPARHILWLERAAVDLPAEPPARVEIGGRLLERRQSFPALLEAVAKPPIDLGVHATISIYQGAAGDAAVAVHGRDRVVVYAGQRIEAGDYDRLGKVEDRA